MDTKEWRALIRKLRKTFPVSGGRIIVYRQPLEHSFGVTAHTGNTYRIRIDSQQCRQVQLDALLHEWAHVIAIERAFWHTPEWGKVYASIFSAWAHDFKG